VNDFKRLLLYQKDDKGLLKVAKNRGLLNRLAYSTTPNSACQTLISHSPSINFTPEIQFITSWHISCHLTEQKWCCWRIQIHISPFKPRYI